MEKYNYRINKISYGLMLGTAIFFDLIQFGLTFIPFIGWIISFYISFMAFLTFWLWFNLKNVGIFDKGLKKIILWLVGPLLDASFSFVPGLTIMIILTYKIVRLDDELDRKNILSKEKQEKIGEFLKKNKGQAGKFVEKYV